MQLALSFPITNYLLCSASLLAKDNNTLRQQIREVNQGVQYLYLLYEKRKGQGRDTQPLSCYQQIFQEGSMLHACPFSPFAQNPLSLPWFPH